jgi:hypothetical protein
MKHQPATTKKHDAMIEHRRQLIQETRLTKQKTQNEGLLREEKQTRLRQRVKCSPAMVNTASNQLA